MAGQPARRALATACALQTGSRAGKPALRKEPARDTGRRRGTDPLEAAASRDPQANLTRQAPADMLISCSKRFRSVALWNGVRGALMGSRPASGCSSWAAWVELHAWAHLKSKRPDLGSGERPRVVLGSKLCDWLLDEERWREGGLQHVWGATRSPEAGRFIIKSLETWPDDQILLDLKQEAQKEPPPSLPPPRDGHIDLFGWWFIIDRGLTPGGAALPPQMMDIYGELAGSHFWGAVLHGLRLAGLLREDTAAEARRQVFDISLEHAIAHYYRDGWKVLTIAKSYDPMRRGQGEDVWGYVHTCVSNYVKNDMMRERDPDLGAIGLTVGDKLRKILDYPGIVIKPRPGGRDADDDEGTALDRFPAHVCRGINHNSGDESASELAERLAKALEACDPVGRALFLLLRVPPSEWTEAGVAFLASALNTDGEKLRDFIRKRDEKLDLLRRRQEAYLNKAGYLSRLVELTRQSIRTVLTREGLSPDEIERKIEAWEKVITPETKRKDLPRIPTEILKRSRFETLEYLVPWLQWKLWERQKAERKAREIEEEIKRMTERFTNEELKVLSRLLRLPAEVIRDRVKDAKDRVDRLPTVEPSGSEPSEGALR